MRSLGLKKLANIQQIVLLKLFYFLLSKDQTDYYNAQFDAYQILKKPWKWMIETPPFSFDCDSDLYCQISLDLCYV